MASTAPTLPDPVSPAARRAEIHDLESAKAAAVDCAEERLRLLHEAQGEAAEYRGRAASLRQEIEKRDRLHEAQVNRLKGESSLLEALLDEIDEDWRHTFECPRCEDNLRHPSEPVCGSCLSAVDPS